MNIWKDPYFSTLNQSAFDFLPSLNKDYNITFEEQKVYNFRVPFENFLKLNKPSLRNHLVCSPVTNILLLLFALNIREYIHISLYIDACRK